MFKTSSREFKLAILYCEADSLWQSYCAPQRNTCNITGECI